MGGEDIIGYICIGLDFVNLVRIHSNIFNKQCIRFARSSGFQLSASPFISFKDSEVTVADTVMLQKWLLESGNLSNWKNADLCEDGVIDIFDMVEMRKLLIHNNSLSAQ